MDDQGLKRRAVRGAGATGAAQAVRMVLQVSSTVVLARLLTPEQFGLVGMVVAVTALADLLKEAGLATAVVQRSSVTHAQVSALFWINSVLGLALAGCVAALAPVLAWFYGRPELLGLTVAMSSVYLLSGLGVQHSALLMRTMRFRAIAVRETLAYAAGAVLAVVAGLAGAGPYSLVVLYVSVATVRTAAVWVACDWRPAAPALRVEGLAPLLRFGGAVSGTSVLNYLARNADNVLIGRVWGASALGLYGRAYSLILLPLQQVTQPLGPVVQAALGRVRDDPERFRAAYATALMSVSLLGLPLVALMVAVADPAVTVLLGRDWAAAIPLFRILAIAGGIQVVATTAGWVYLSTGRATSMLRWTLWTRPLIVLSFVVGLSWGPTGVASAYAMVTALLLLPGMANAARGTSLGPLSWFSAAWRPAVVAAGVGVGAWSCRLASDPAGDIVSVLAGLAGGVIVWSCAVLAWPRLRHLVQDVARQLRKQERADVG